MEKQNLTQQKQAFTNKKKYTTNKHKKLMPGLVASYAIRPGKGVSILLFWYQPFINLSLTFFDTYSLTAPDPSYRNTNDNRERSAQ